MTTLHDLPLRTELVGKEPYGAPIHDVSITLNVNENPFAAPEHVIQDIADAVAEAARNANRYPDPEATTLRKHLAAYITEQTSGVTQVTGEEVWAANGSNEVMQQILLAFGGPGRSLMSFVPSYSMYPILADITGTKWISAPRNDSYEVTPEMVRAAIAQHRPNITVLCGPNNPTGTRLDPETVRAAYEATDGIVIVDEAYHEFDEQTPSAVTMLEGRPRLLVMRTMSKAFAFAGARVGYLVADPAVIDAMRLIRLPYHLSSFTQAAASVAVKHAPTMMSMVGELRKQRERLAEELTNMGYQVHPSGSNFLLVGGFANPDDAFEYLLARGILIRNLSIPGHLRLTVGTEAETTALIEAIREL